MSRVRLIVLVLVFLAAPVYHCVAQEAQEEEKREETTAQTYTDEDLTGTSDTPETSLTFDQVAGGADAGPSAEGEDVTPEVTDEKEETDEELWERLIAETAEPQEGGLASGIGKAQGVKGMNERVSLDLRNIDITDALKFLAFKGGLNITISKNVSGRLALLVEDVPIRDVFDIILRSNDLAYEQQGSIYHVMTEGEYETRYGKKYNDIRQLKIFRIQYASPAQVFTVIDSLKSSVGRALVDQESGTAILLDTPAKIIEVERAIEALETHNETKVFSLKYAKVEEVLPLLEEHIDAKNLGNVQKDERTNQIVVRTLPDRMQEVEKLIIRLDEKTREVLIDTSVIQLSLADDATKGIEWEGLFDRLGKSGLEFIGSYPFRPLSRTGLSQISEFVDYDTEATTTVPTAGSKVFPSEKLFIGSTTTDEDWEVMIKFMQTLGETKLLSNPRLAVVNNQEATIHVGTREAFVTTTTTQGTSTSTVAENVSFVDVGIKLSVTPTINQDRYVTMKVKPEISSVVRTLKTPSGNQIPIVDTSTAQTTVMVKDGTTIIIGGLRKDEKKTSEDSAPFLSDIPLLGKLFRDYSQDNEWKELLVLMTPHIVEGDKLVSGSGLGIPDGVEPKPPVDYDRPTGLLQGKGTDEAGRFELGGLGESVEQGESPVAGFMKTYRDYEPLVRAQN
ncbi:MAG: hypothetical protein HYY14_06780 [Candidatus Omnitrophica bacterium]|nr:hypothetical protein [Candidatus Omnitrophota bacterium]